MAISQEQMHAAIPGASKQIVKFLDMILESDLNDEEKLSLRAPIISACLQDFVAYVALNDEEYAEYAEVMALELQMKMSELKWEEGSDGATQ